jgi:hypothetical protein
MRALYQSLAALDPHTFELLIFQLVKAGYPHVDVKHVDGSAGDLGIDVISGQLDEQPTIWQCKSFLNGIKDSQKRQIKDSLDQALRHFKPRRWILCLTTDMDIRGLHWFQRLASSRANTIQITLWPASDLVRQLLYQHTIREAFFPNTVISTREVREALAKTGELTAAELSTITAETANLYIQRLQAYDTRFTYALTFVRDIQPERIQAPGALLTIFEENHILAVYGRDTEALRQSPPRASFKLHGMGIEKLFLNVCTGAPQTLYGSEISEFSSDFDFLIGTCERDQIIVHLESIGSPKNVSLRVIFGPDCDAIVYESVPFVRVGPGKYQSAGVLPFQTSITIKNDGTGRLTFKDRTKGCDVNVVQKFLRALNLAISTGKIAFYNETTRLPFLTYAVHGSIPGLAVYKGLIDDAVCIARAYQAPLRLPSAISSEDVQAISRLKQLLVGVTLDADEICLELTKTIDLTTAVADGLHGDSKLLITISTPGFPQGFVVFGTAIQTGPVDVEIFNPRVRERDAFIQFVRHAELGATTTLTFEITKPTIVRRAQPEPGDSA